ncbi:MAG: pilus assembly PilX N-terminal domain-containing protein [Nitrospirae bacterium]|nr:pilus assembly PilX N-terminal domain-containing protein [Nitrospirota bacterium]
MPGVLGQERGAALVMSLVIMLVLTFLGIIAMLTSTTELSLSGNYRLSKEAYYAADGGMTYVLRDKQYFALTNPTTLTTPNFPVGGVDLTVNGASASGTVELLASNQAAPDNTGNDVTINGQVHANYYKVTSLGSGNLNSQSRQIVIKAELVPSGN